MIRVDKRKVLKGNRRLAAFAEFQADAEMKLAKLGVKIYPETANCVTATIGKTSLCICYLRKYPPVKQIMKDLCKTYPDFARKIRYRERHRGVDLHWFCPPIF